MQFPDSRPKACSHRSLFVRRTPTRPRARGQEPHFTHRLGRHVALPRGDGPALCARVERILAPQRSRELGACSPAVEDEAQRRLAGAGRRLTRGPAAPADGADDPSADLPRVDVDSLELVRPRSVGVEHVALWAMRQLRPPSLLEELGLSGAQHAADLFALQPTVTLHDRISTCFEGAADRRPLARRGHSREKRHELAALPGEPLLRSRRAADHSGIPSQQTCEIAAQDGGGVLR